MQSHGSGREASAAARFDFSNKSHWRPRFVRRAMICACISLSLSLSLSLSIYLSISLYIHVYIYIYIYTHVYVVTNRIPPFSMTSSRVEREQDVSARPLFKGGRAELQRLSAARDRAARRHGHRQRYEYCYYVYAYVYIYIYICIHTHSYTYVCIVMHY